MAAKERGAVAVPDDLQLLSAARLAQLMDCDVSTVYDLQNRRLLPYVVITDGEIRPKRCTSLADYRKFVKDRSVAVLAS